MREIGLNILLFTVALYGCTSNKIATGSSPRQLPELTLLDFQTSNGEHLRPGIEKLVGTDSGGIRAMQYIKDYEAILEKYYPANRIAVDLQKSDGVTNTYPLFESSHPLPTAQAPPPPGNDAATQQFLKILREENLTAMINLGKNYDVYVKSGNLDYARLALVNGYVVVMSNPTPSQTAAVCEKMEPVLEALQAGW